MWHPEQIFGRGGSKVDAFCSRFLEQRSQCLPGIGKVDQLSFIFPENGICVGNTTGKRNRYFPMVGFPYIYLLRNIFDRNQDSQYRYLHSVPYHILVDLATKRVQDCILFCLVTIPYIVFNLWGITLLTPICHPDAHLGGS